MVYEFDIVFILEWWMWGILSLSINFLSILCFCGRQRPGFIVWHEHFSTMLLPLTGRWRILSVKHKMANRLCVFIPVWSNVYSCKNKCSASKWMKCNSNQWGKYGEKKKRSDAGKYIVLNTRHNYQYKSLWSEWETKGTISTVCL